MLPEDTQEGDWIEIGMLGAYGSAMQTRFNGFHSSQVATVWPEATPMAIDRPRRRVALRIVEPPMQAELQIPVPAERPAEPQETELLAGAEDPLVLE
jgi:hypothetical protein